MSKILVFSDNHGSIAGIKKAYKSHIDAKCFIFAGDGKNLFDEYCKSINMPYYSVNGNCDENYMSDTEKTFIIDGLKFYLTHGHILGGDMYYSLQERALENDADIAICGHSHVAENINISSVELPDRERNLYLLNPGSISRPRDNILSPSYAVINIIGGIPVFGIGRL